MRNLLLEDKEPITVQYFEALYWIFHMAQTTHSLLFSVFVELLQKFYHKLNFDIVTQRENKVELYGCLKYL